MIKFYRKAFTLVEILIVVAIIGVIVSIALPNYLRSSTTSKKTVCVNNLKQIDSAIDRWAADNAVSTGVVPTSDIYNYIKRGRPVCPSGGTYTLYAVGAKPQVKCSFEGEGHKLPQ